MIERLSINGRTGLGDLKMKKAILKMWGATGFSRPFQYKRRLQSPPQACVSAAFRIYDLLTARHEKP
jgi:hypothetical protein